MRCTLIFAVSISDVGKANDMIILHSLSLAYRFVQESCSEDWTNLGSYILV